MSLLQYSTSTAPSLPWQPSWKGQGWQGRGKDIFCWWGIRWGLMEGGRKILLPLITWASSSGVIGVKSIMKCGSGEADCGVWKWWEFAWQTYVRMAWVVLVGNPGDTQDVPQLSNSPLPYPKKSWRNCLQVSVLLTERAAWRHLWQLWSLTSDRNVAASAWSPNSLLCVCVSVCV